MAAHLQHMAAEHEHPDSWHRHTTVEGEPQAEHGAIASPAVIAKWFSLLTLSIVGSVVLLSVYFTTVANQFKAEQREISLSAEADAYKETALAVLSNPWRTTQAWASPDHVKLPIDAAMDRVITRYKTVN